MKINNSLARFNGLINGLVFGGLLLAIIGIIVMATNGMNLTAIMNGVALLYIGGGALGLGIFGAFLRITATSIIEGLGGNLIVSGAEAYAAVHEPKAAEAANTVKTTVNTGPSDAWQSLSGKEYKAWQAAGEPDLRPWDEAGQPEFFGWLSSRG
jgi:hypothetical protein